MTEICFGDQLNTVDFKVLLFVYKALLGLAPQYIADLLKPYSVSRSLRSCNQLLLLFPGPFLTEGDWAFAVAAPKQWNALPVAVRSSPTLDTFKSRLKTNLFSLAYGVAWEYWGYKVVYGSSCMFLFVSYDFFLSICCCFLILFNYVYKLYSTKYHDINDEALMHRIFKTYKSILARFCKFSYRVPIHDEILFKDLFSYGLNEPTRSFLPGGEFNCSLRDIMDYALLLCGSPFTVGEAEPLPKMATIPDTFHKMSASPERAPITESNPESASVPESSSEMISVHDHCPMFISTHDLRLVSASASEQSSVFALAPDLSLVRSSALDHSTKMTLVHESAPESTLVPESAPEFAGLSESISEPPPAPSLLQSLLLSVVLLPSLLQSMSLIQSLLLFPLRWQLLLQNLL